MSREIGTHAFHVIFFVLASAVFVRAILFRIGLVRKGQKVEQLAPLEGKLRSFLINVLFQRKLFLHPARGIMHGFVFYGFVAYLFHTSSQMVAGNLWTLFIANGIDPYGFNVADYVPFDLGLSGGQAMICILGSVGVIALLFVALNNIKIGKKFQASKSAGMQWLFLVAMLGLLGGIFALMIGSGAQTYEAIVQYFSVLVLIGLGYFSYRRWVRRSEELTIPSVESAVVIYLIATLMVSTLAAGAASAMLSGHHASFISAATGKILHWLGMVDKTDAVAVRNFSWWVHLASVYIFMMYVPTAKHSHLIFAPMNYFMARNAPRGQIKMMDLENSTVYGASNLNELPWSSLLDGLSCIECGRCTVQCPANRTGKPLDPRKIIVDIKHALVEHAGALAAHTDENPQPSPVLGGHYISDEEIFACTSCYACVEACPVGNNQLEAILEMRRNLVLVESRFPQQLQLAFNNMEKNSNPWGVAAHTRADWCSDLGVKTMAEDSKVDVLYWVGCAGSFDERNKKIARSLVKIMQKANVKFGILGTEENCTGDSARRGGNEYLYQTLAQTNIETLNRYGVKKIVTACPHCYNTLKNEYPQMGGNYDVVHHSDFIDDLIRDEKIEMDPAAVESMKERRGVYHDSCYLGRYNDVYDQPRDVARAALGMDLAEASDHGSTSLCCGAGGAQMWMEEQYERVNEKRTGQLLDTGADTIATACPFCITMITDGVKSAHLDDKVKVLDIAELVAASMKGGEGAVAGGFARETAGAKH